MGRLAVVVLAALVFTCSAAARQDSEIVRLVDVGSGASEAWVFLPEHQPQCILTFIHDSGASSPAQYTSWLDYTVLRDQCAIVFPRYQTGAKTTATADLRGLRAGVATGMGYVRRVGFAAGGAAAFSAAPTISAGLGTGATLALTFATRAQSWGYRAPAAVDVVFPIVDAEAQLPAAKLAPNVRVLVQFGDRDRRAGTANAAVKRYLAGRPAARTSVQVVRSSATFSAVHTAPLLETTPAENAFWGPLDNLIGTIT